MRNCCAAKFLGTANPRETFPQADKTGLILHCWHKVKIKYSLQERECKGGENQPCGSETQGKKRDPLNIMQTEKGIEV